jgi:hypothetical protein
MRYHYVDEKLPIVRHLGPNRLMVVCVDARAGVLVRGGGA